MQEKMSVINLADDDGHKVRLVKVKMPMMISNRSTITTMYTEKKEDGTQIVVMSSKGNEAIIAANESAIDGDVIAINHIAYTSWKAYEGGMEMVSVTSTDPSGSIPDFIKNK